MKRTLAIVALAAALVACGDAGLSETDIAIAECVDRCEERNETVCYPIERECEERCSTSTAFVACREQQPGNCVKECDLDRQSFCPDEDPIHCESGCFQQLARCEMREDCDATQQFTQQPMCIQ